MTGNVPWKDVRIETTVHDGTGLIEVHAYDDPVQRDIQSTARVLSMGEGNTDVSADDLVPELTEKALLKAIHERAPEGVHDPDVPTSIVLHTDVELSDDLVDSRA